MLSTHVLSVVDLLPGDLIFWVPDAAPKEAGHVAVVYTIDKDPKKVRIIHATEKTNEPYYNSLCITHLISSDRLCLAEDPKEKHKHYKVIRGETKLIDEMMRTLTAWVEYQVPFDHAKLKAMEIYAGWGEHSKEKPIPSIEMQIVELSAKAAQEDFRKRLTVLYARRYSMPVEGFTCSSVMIDALQVAFLSLSGVKEQDFSKVDFADHFLPGFFIASDLATPTLLLNLLLTDKRFETLEGSLENSYVLDEEDKEKIKLERKLYTEKAIIKIAEFEMNLAVAGIGSPWLPYANVKMGREGDQKGNSNNGGRSKLSPSILLS